MNASVLCSSGLFGLAYITYERLGRGRLLINNVIKFISRMALLIFVIKLGFVQACSTEKCIIIIVIIIINFIGILGQENLVKAVES